MKSPITTAVLVFLVAGSFSYSRADEPAVGSGPHVVTQDHVVFKGTSPNLVTAVHVDKVSSSGFSMIIQLSIEVLGNPTGDVLIERTQTEGASLLQFFPLKHLGIDPLSLEHFTIRYDWQVYPNLDAPRTAMQGMIEPIELQVGPGFDGKTKCSPLVVRGKKTTQWKEWAGFTVAVSDVEVEARKERVRK